jgi:hypothetical protein
MPTSGSNLEPATWESAAVNIGTLALCSSGALAGHLQSVIIAVQMKPEHWISIAQLTMTLVALFAGPWWAVKRSQKQFLSQKLWDKRQETYSQLLGDLSLLTYYYGNLTESIEISRDYQPPEAFMDKVRAAQHTLEMHAAVGAYLISDRAARSITSCVQASHKQYQHHHDHSDSCWKATEEAITIVKGEAGKYLNLDTK